VRLEGRDSPWFAAQQKSKPSTHSRLPKLAIAPPASCCCSNALREGWGRGGRGGPEALVHGDAHGAAPLHLAGLWEM
jgi:hypothetical protein